MTHEGQGNNAAYSGGPPTKEEHSRDSPPRRGFWRFIPEADVSNAIATILLVGVGIWGVVETRHALELSERAWVAVVGGVVTEQPTAGQPMHLAVTYANSGKEPATDLSFASDSGSITKPLNNDFTGVAVRPNATCKGLKPTREGGTVVPGSINMRGSDSARGNNPVMLTDAIVKGDIYYYTQGCFAYHTFGRTHHSAFCYLFLTDSSKPWQQTRVTACPIGNTVD